MRIVLHGLNGVYNYGCEGIIRGTYNIIQNEFPNVEMVYLSKNYQDDCKRLKDLESLNIINNELTLTRRVLRAGLRKLNLAYYNVDSEGINKIKDNDIILSVGGDMFTLPTKPYPSSPKTDQTTFLSRLKRKKIKAILWGASVGPFEDWPEGKEFYLSELKRMNTVCAREKKTVDYLTLNKIKNIKEVVDPAYAMKAVESNVKITDLFKSKNKIIGVNLSPLSAKYNSNGEKDILVKQIETIKTLSKKYNILLIPHVFSHDINDDDLRYLSIIKENLEHIDAVKIIKSDIGSCKMKHIISQLDLLVASRMHCAVAGVSTSVPTIFLSYSEKAKGMAKFVYGDENYCKELTFFNDKEFYIYIDDFSKSQEDVKGYLLSQKERFIEGAYLSSKVIKDVNDA